MRGRDPSVEDGGRYATTEPPAFVAYLPAVALSAVALAIAFLLGGPVAAAIA